MKVRIKKKPKYDSGGLTQANFLNTMTQFPNLYHNYSNVGIINSNPTGTTDDDITDKLLPVDRDLANIEAEKGEVIVKPMLEGMYKVGGKVHEQGGTPLNVEEGSFVFSNTPELAFSTEQLQMLGAKETMKDPTPAKVVQSLVKPKDYNNILNILSDPKIDKIKKESALLELERMQKAIGEVAFLQELQKGINGDAPDFAKIPNNPMSEPIKDTQQMQYAKKGGNVYTDGGITAWKGDRTGRKNASAYSDTQWRQFAKDVGFTGTTNQEFQNFLYKDPRFKSLIDTLHKNNLPGPNKGMMDGLLGVRWDGVYDNYYKQGDGKAKLPPISTLNAKFPVEPDPGPPPPTVNTALSNVPVEKDRTVKDDWGGIKLKATPLEKLTTVAPFIANLLQSPEYAMLAQMYTPDLRLDRANMEDAKQRTQESATTSKRMAFNNLRGQQAIAAALGIDAEADQRISSIESQEENINAETGNRESMINLQNKINDRNFNVSQILEVDAKNSLTTQRRGEEIASGAIQSLNNAGQLERSLRDTENMMNMMASPYISGEKNPDGTDKLYMGKDGKLHQRQGVPFGFDQNRNLRFNSNFGSLDSFGVGMNQQGATQEILDGVTKNFIEAIQSKNPDAIKAASMAYYTILRGNFRGPSALQNANTFNNQLMQSLMMLQNNMFGQFGQPGQIGQ